MRHVVFEARVARCSWQLLNYYEPIEEIEFKIKLLPSSGSLFNKAEKKERDCIVECVLNHTMMDTDDIQERHSRNKELLHSALANQTQSTK